MKYSWNCSLSTIDMIHKLEPCLQLKYVRQVLFKIFQIPFAQWLMHSSNNSVKFNCISAVGMFKWNLILDIKVLYWKLISWLENVNRAISFSFTHGELSSLLMLFQQSRKAQTNCSEILAKYLAKLKWLSQFND